MISQASSLEKAFRLDQSIRARDNLENRAGRGRAIYEEEGGGGFHVSELKAYKKATKP